MDGKAQPVRDETCPDLKVLHIAMTYIDSFMSPKYLQFKRSEPPPPKKKPQKKQTSYSWNSANFEFALSAYPKLR